MIPQARTDGASRLHGIARLLDTAATRAPERVALVDGARCVSYATLAAFVLRLARALVGMGLGRHERVAVYAGKSIEAVATIFAACAAGLIAVPVNPKLKPHQVRHILDDCRAAALVTTPFRLAQLAMTIDARALRLVLLPPGDGAALPCKAVYRWDELVTEERKRVPVHRSIDVDPTAILYTSGSTGLPKGVVISHRNLLAGAESVNAYLGTAADDVVLALLPLSFDAGLSQITTAAAAGARVVLHDYIEPREVAAACAAQAVTSVTGVPPLWTQLAAVDWCDDARRSMRIIASTGGHMPGPLLGRLRTLFPGARPYLMYGLTEAFRSTYLDPGEIDRRPESIGKAIPDAEILVLREDGSPCAPGEVGELVHRGALVTLGYWNDPQRTAERFRPLPQRPAPGLVPEIAVWSGDIVRTDAEGFLYFVGRRDDMIKSSGYRISPTEVEAVLYDAPGVREAAVFGVPDEALGQRVHAVVAAIEPPLDEARVLDHCRRSLPSYMVPNLLEVPALPRTPNGKVDRPRLPSLHREHEAGEGRRGVTAMPPRHAAPP